MKKALGILSRNALTTLNCRYFSYKLPIVEPEFDEERLGLPNWR